VPTYQYACTACGEQLEMVQKFSDDPLTVCPACSGRLRKVFSPVGIVFKGSGFYRTDSRSSNGSLNGATDAKTGESPAADSGSKADSSGDKGDKKPAAASSSSSSKDSSSGVPSAARSSGSTGEKVA
jgi:putative FmdB family regulatory protein